MVCAFLRVIALKSSAILASTEVSTWPTVKKAKAQRGTFTRIRRITTVLRSMLNPSRFVIKPPFCKTKDAARPGWNQRVACRANVPREERSRKLSFSEKGELEESRSEGKPYTPASVLRKARLDVYGTSVWQRATRRLPISAEKELSA